MIRGWDFPCIITITLFVIIIDLYQIIYRSTFLTNWLFIHFCSSDHQSVDPVPPNAPHQPADVTCYCDVIAGDAVIGCRTQGVDVTKGESLAAGKTLLIGWKWWRNCSSVWQMCRTVCVCVYVFMYVCMCVYVYVCMCVCVYVYICVCLGREHSVPTLCMCWSQVVLWYVMWTFDELTTSTWQWRH